MLAWQTRSDLSDPNEMLVKISRLNLPFKFVHIPSIDGAGESLADNVTTRHPPGLSPLGLKANILSAEYLNLTFFEERQ